MSYDWWSCPLIKEGMLQSLSMVLKLHMYIHGPRHHSFLHTECH